MRDKYTKRFPEIDSLNLTAIDYAKTVIKFDRSEDIGKINLTGILPASTVLIISMTTTTTTGKPLSDEEYDYVLMLSNTILEMNQVRIKLLLYIESKMEQVAPNVTAIVGSSITSQLIGIAGGLKQLANIPAGNIQVLGSGRKELAGMSILSAGLHTGIIATCDLVQNTSLEYRTKAQRLVAAKVCLAARIDKSGSSRDGSIGKNYYSEIVDKLEKAAEAAPAKLEKPIPPPAMESKKKRGGRKARRMKELVAMTQARKLQNRVAFGQEEAEIIVGSSVVGMGMLSKTESGKLRAPPVDNKAREVTKKHAAKLTTGFFSNNRLDSTTPRLIPKVQIPTLSIESGINLAYPEATTEHSQPNRSKYFSTTNTFKRK